MNPAKVVGLIAGALLLAGLIFGFVPVYSVGSDCGSAFVGSSDPFGGDACDELRSLVRQPAISLTVVGALGLLVATTMDPGPQPTQTPTRPPRPAGPAGPAGPPAPPGKGPQQPPSPRREQPPS